MDDKRAVTASRYTFEQLADIYNQARVDYIVPMPMNAKRMAEYVHNYDVDLDASVVSLNEAGLESGVGMVGLRGERGWITRLGVVPHRRGRRLGQYLMERMIEQARARDCTLVQLEVIVGNDPARNLFLKLGFEDTRQLLIIRRPPGAPLETPELEATTAEEMPEDEIPAYLEKREPGASWVEETASLLNAGRLCGQVVTMPDGEKAWVVYQRSPFQLAHFVLSPDTSEQALKALIYHVHKVNSKHDTRIENVPLDDPNWAIFQQMGYIEEFRRQEMFLYF